ncbi:hypothetical protein D9M68_100150 [compost metagenome]
MEKMTDSSGTQSTHPILNGLSLVIPVIWIWLVLYMTLAQVNPLYLLLAAITAVALFFRSLLYSWLGRRVKIVTAIFAVASLAVVTTQPWSRQEQAERAAAKEHSRIVALRATDPSAYLAELKTANSQEYESELKELNPAVYAALMTSRAAEEERKRMEEIAALKSEVVRGSLTREREVIVYRQLAKLVPTDKVIVEKAARLEAEDDRLRAAADLLNEQRTRPKDFVWIVKQTYRKVAFDTILQVDFTIKNGLPWSIKDITITCELYSPSLTKIDQNTRTIYERIEGGKTRIFRNFDMGFIHSQTAKGRCHIDGIIEG